MRGHSPVLTMVVLLWEVFLVVSEEVIELNALSEVFDCFHAPDLFKEVEVSIHIDAGKDQSVPLHALELDIGVVLLELEVHSLVEVYVRPFDSVHVLSRHLELVEVKVLWKYFHFSL